MIHNIEFQMLYVLYRMGKSCVLGHDKGLRRWVELLCSFCEVIFVRDLMIFHDEISWYLNTEKINFKKSSKSLVSSLKGTKSIEVLSTYFIKMVQNFNDVFCVQRWGYF